MMSNTMSWKKNSLPGLLPLVIWYVYQIKNTMLLLFPSVSHPHLHIYPIS